MTAQNMGKKILTDAGYEVVAVSNGAAAVKKIAEQKPDIIILDVYMPGYSGLEVCEKVRASIDTMKTPVLLTVGKMEPYKSEDATRVRADGVIIKPFEASDLLAIVKKLEERIVPKAPPLAEQTILLERPPDFSQFEQDSFHVTPEMAHAEERSTAPLQVDVPDHMASSAAFGDMLGMGFDEEPAPPPPPPPPPVVVTAPVMVPPPIEVPPPEPVSSPAFVAEEEPLTAPVSRVSPGAIFVADSIADAIQAEPAPVSSSGPVSEILKAREFQVVGSRQPAEPARFDSTRFDSVLQESPRSGSVPPEAPQAPQPPVMPVNLNASAVAVVETPPPPPPPMEVAEMPPAAEQAAAPDSIPAITEFIAPPEPEPEPEVIHHEANPALRHIEVTPDPAFEPPTTAASLEVPHTQDPDFQPTSQGRVSDNINPPIDPGLLVDAAALNSFPTKFGVDNPEDVPVGVAAEVPELQAIEMLPPEQSAEEVPEPEASASVTTEESASAATVEPVTAEEFSAPAGEAPVTEEDFEARVARAMSVYEQPMEAEVAAEAPEPAAVAHETVAEPEPAPEPETMVQPFGFSPAVEAAMLAPVTDPPVVPPPAPIQDEPDQATDKIVAEEKTAEEISASSSAIHGTIPATIPATQAVPPAPEQPAVTAPVSVQAGMDVARQVASHIEAHVPATTDAVAASSGNDHHDVADLVHRVMERLKPGLIEEIVRELKEKK